MHAAGWGACGIDIKVNLIAMLFMHHTQYVTDTDLEVAPKL